MDGNNEGQTYVDQVKTILTDTLTYANKLEPEARRAFILSLDSALEELAVFVEDNMSEELVQELSGEVTNE